MEIVLFLIHFCATFNKFWFPGCKLHSLLMGFMEQISWESAHSLMHLFNCKYFPSPCGLPGSGFTVVNERGKAHEPEYPLRIPILFGPYATSGEGQGEKGARSR